MTTEAEAKQSRETTTRFDYRGSYRYRVIFVVLRPFVRFLMWVLFNYKPIRYHEDKNKAYFILSNHTGALDPLLLALSFHRPVFFVASDHIFRLGWLSRLLDWLVAPIPIVKSKVDLAAIRTMHHELNSGRTVALFPSGSRSVDGSEEPIPQATAKLLKKLKMPVLLYRLEGGYLTSPRWAKHHRRGRMYGSVIMHFTEKDLETTETAELSRMLDQFLEANPYRSPRRLEIPYRGRKLAESLERIIYLCPSCERLATLHSQNDILSCPCGFSLRYEETGGFGQTSWNPEDQQWANKFPDVSSLYQWQLKHMEQVITPGAMAVRDADTPFFTDKHEKFTMTQRAKRNIKLFTAELRLYKDRLKFRDEKSGEIKSFPIREIMDITVIGPQLIQFTHQPTGMTYESQNKKPRSAYKYVNLILHLKQLDKRATEHATGAGNAEKQHVAL